MELNRLILAAVASTHRSAPCTRAAISSGVNRPQCTVMPAKLPCSSLPSGVATLTRTSAPSWASCREKMRPSVVPLNTTALIRGPLGMNWKNISGVALLGGIGFTVSLFIANLSFGSAHPVLLNQAKLGVLSGTVMAGILGYLVLYWVLPKRR